jgi:Xaa-Pro aminopeptidase
MARLIQSRVPYFGRASEPPPWRLPRNRYERRIGLLRDRMEAEGLSHVLVYGDREHFANLLWLCGLDPRFEEALCIVPADDREPLLLLGNECMGYAPAAPALVRLERYQPFSLPDQPRDDSRALSDILCDEGLNAHTRCGVAGWKKYAAAYESDVPSHIVDAARFACGFENVVNVAEWFSSPAGGFRAAADAEEIVFFEWTNTLASDGMARVIEAIRPGALDYSLLERAQYNGVPLSAHMTLKCGANRASLASACGQRIERGGRFSCGIAYWGANCCRCGWVAAGPEDLPAEARDYVEAFAGPYFDAMAAWFGALRAGGLASDLHEAVHSRLPEETFHVFLNAGHLIGFEEWISSPVYAQSPHQIYAGMVLQADVIPSHPVYYSSRMEDGYALADEHLQRQLTALAPGLMERCRERREWMRSELGLPVHDTVLPLSNLCGVVPPFLLNPKRILATG